MLSGLDAKRGHAGGAHVPCRLDRSDTLRDTRSESNSYQTSMLMLKALTHERDEEVPFRAD